MIVHCKYHVGANLQLCALIPTALLRLSLDDVARVQFPVYIQQRLGTHPTFH